MKSLIKAVAVSMILAGPVVALAQTDQQATRAQVREDLIKAENAGYNPSDWLHYPQNIQAAETRVAAQEQAAGNTGYGPGASGQSQEGRAAGSVTVSPYSAPVDVAH
jgi:hypothetical protein